VSEENANQVNEIKQNTAPEERPMRNLKEGVTEITD